MQKKGSKGPKKPQKAPFSRALFGFFICVGPFGALAPPCIITDRSLKFNILKSQKVLDGMVASFCTSLTSNVLARYSNQLFHSVEEVRPDKSYSVMICSAEQVLQNRKELGMKLAQLDQSRKRSVETSVETSVAP